MIDVHEPVFPPSVVARLTGVPQTTIQTWMNRDTLRNLDAARKSGRGKARLFSVADVYTLAIFAEATKIVEDSRTLAAVLPMAIADVLRGEQLTRFSIHLMPPGEGVHVAYDRPQDAPPPEGAHIEIHVFIKRMMDALAPKIAAELE